MAPNQSLTWRKSSRSNGNGGNCVEIRGDLAAVRDSKNPDGPTLNVGLGGLLSAVKAGKLNKS